MRDTRDAHGNAIGKREEYIHTYIPRASFHLARARAHVCAYLYPHTPEVCTYYFYLVERAVCAPPRGASRFFTPPLQPLKLHVARHGKRRFIFCHRAEIPDETPSPSYIPRRYATARPPCKRPQFPRVSRRGSVKLYYAFLSPPPPLSLLFLPR